MTRNETTGTNVSASVRSMTGFARASQSHSGVVVDVEVRSVNHRFFELAYKAPRCYSEFERDARTALQKHHKRGRVDLLITRRCVTSETAVERDWSALDTAVGVYSEACKRYGVKGDHLASFLAQAILKESSRSEDAGEVSEQEAELVISALTAASEALAVMREQEGSWLAQEIGARLGAIEAYIESIRPLAAEVPIRFKARLDERLQTLSPHAQVDPARVAQEVAILADRTDITEELSRLGSHFLQFRTTLAGHPEGVGRRLDFLIQEIGREVNTIGSKAQDARIQGTVVETKAELEKIREQVQNIE